MSISAGRFREILEAAKEDGTREVSGAIDVEPGSFPGGLDLSEFHFTNRLRIRGSRFRKDVIFDRCAFDEGIDLSGARFASRLAVIGGLFDRHPATAAEQTQMQAEQSESPIAEAPIALEFARFSSDVEIAGAEIKGPLLARGCEVAGDFRLTSVRIEARAPLKVGEPGNDESDRAGASASGKAMRSDHEATLFDLSHARIEGDLVLGFEPSAFVKERVKAADSKPAWLNTNTEINCHKAESTIVNLGLVTVDGALVLNRARCKGSIDATHATLGMLSIRRGRIKGSLTLSAAKIGFVEIAGLTMNGSFLMITGETGQINIQSSFDPRLGDDHCYKPTSIRAVVYVGCRSSDWVRFGIASLGAEQQGQPAFGVRGIRIANCTIAGDLEFYRDVGAMRAFEQSRDNLAAEGRKALHCNPFLRGLKTDDPISITGCTISGHLDLTNVRTEGVIDLRDNTVTNSIRFMSPLSARATKAGKDEMRKALILLGCAIRRGDLQKKHRDFMVATARRLDLERTVAGAIDLTGLRLLRKDAEDGSVLASHVDVNRELLIARRVTSDEHEHFLQGLENLVERAPPAIKKLLERTLRLCLRDSIVAECGANGSLLAGYLKFVGLTRTSTDSIEPPSALATIPGSLKLDKSRIGLLRLSAEAFEQPANARNPKGIELDDARVGVLRIYRTVSENPDDNGFPRPIRMPGVTVISWRLGEDRQTDKPSGRPPTVEATDEIRESGDSGPYLDVLDNDDDYRASNYLSVEKALRNRGHERAANEVFIAGRYRAQRAHLKKGSRGAWDRGLGRLRAKRTFFRMRRAPGDSVEAIAGIVAFVAILLGIAFGVPFLIGKCPALASWSPFLKPAAVVGVLFGAFLILLSGLFRPSVLRVIDRLYWSLVDYGTSARRLMLVIIVLAIPSFVFVALDRRNFEPTAQVYLAATTPWNPSMGHLDERFPVPCAQGNWNPGEALWMTLRYHIPLISLGVMEKCTPTDSQLFLLGWQPDWFKPRDWFGAMAVINFILWPLFIPFLLRRFWRDERRG